MPLAASGTLSICNDLTKCKFKHSVLNNKHRDLFHLRFPCTSRAVEAHLSYPTNIMSITANVNAAEKMALQEDDLCAEEPSLHHYPARWEFLKSLPHRLIRDIAFVIASPDLLLASNELPTVNADMLGGDTWKWNESKKWLKELDLQHVTDWFGARKHRTRLGDHFAACIEYVLRFSPAVQVEHLVVSQQVRQQVHIDCMQSFCQNNGMRFENNTLDPASQESERLETSTNRTDLSEVNILQMSEGDFNVPLKAEIADNVAACAGDSYGIHRQKNKLFRKMIKLKSSKTVIRTIGEFDFLFQHSHVNQDASKSTSRGKQCADGFGTIRQDASESEFPRKSVFEEEVHHWEASVKFLLYAGPWEAFGFESQDSATWKAKRLDDALEESLLHKHQNQDIPESQITIGNPSNLSEFLWESNEFLGCFLGPHVGETLYNRKSRLQNQLALSQNPFAASFLCRTYGISELSEQAENSDPFSDRHVSKEGRNITVAENESVLKIVPGALLKGFLFYEYELWQLLRGPKGGNKAFNTCGLCSRLIVNSSKVKQAMDPNVIVEACSNGDASHLHETNYHIQCSWYKSKSIRSKLNPKHWMGWWTHMDEFAKFAEHVACEKSRWYIVPKQEWISPVIINGSDLDGCAKVLTLESFLTVAAKVAEEAALSQIPRKRCFMVAEVCWEADFTYPMESQGQFEEGDNSLLHSCGSWIEASRGFVVEETWPDSRAYRPHGYAPNWSHSLHGGIK